LAFRNYCALGAAIALLGTAASPAHRARGTFGLDVARGPYFPQTVLSVQGKGIYEPFSLQAIGPVDVDGTIVTVRSASGDATLIGAAPGAIAVANIAVASPPSRSRPLLAVASYDDGVALHDPRTFALLGTLGIAGAAADVAFLNDGSIATADTDGTRVTVAGRSPWNVRVFDNIPLANELLVDRALDALFVSNRDIDNGAGALTRIDRDGKVLRVKTGITAEGLALDERRQLIYVSNVNDDSVAVLDAATMTVRRKIRTVPRPFGLALEPGGKVLYVVSNTPRTVRTPGGNVERIDLVTGRSRRSAPLGFPLGASFDAAHRLVYVTDEGDDRVFALDARTLAIRKIVPTCRTPWRPRLTGDRLYVPCARANRVDVLAVPGLRRVRGAPFATGGFPLGVALWNY
jgi:YVTN family beta-propeller protein